MRISTITIYGADPSLAEVARGALQGSYAGIIPRDSIFFFPSRAVRSAILAVDPNILALSIFREGLTSISIKADERVAIGRWCGLAPTQGVEEYCYLFDANGLVYAAAASTTETVNPFTLYAPLVGNTLEPLHSTIIRAESLPATFDFARQLATFGSQVRSIIINGDEVNDYLVSGSRVTYVLGGEQAAFTALTSAKGSFTLADGSIDYIDLRFPGKVYLKRKE